MKSKVKLFHTYQYCQSAIGSGSSDREVITLQKEDSASL